MAWRLADHLRGTFDPANYTYDAIGNLVHDTDTSGFLPSGTNSQITHTYYDAAAMANGTFTVDYLKSGNHDGTPRENKGRAWCRNFSEIY